MKITLGFSPCPNDTFIFDALVNGKIKCDGPELEVVLEDVQTLNEWAQQGRLDVSKVSYGVLPNIISQYGVLESGGALGMGVGPLLISQTGLPGNEMDIPKSLVNAATIAIPGKDTTAHFLFSQAFPEAQQKVFLRFDEIENWVMAGNGLGVIIHENRFTYAQKGLHKWADLGTLWEQQTGLPIPLGGMVAKRTLPPEVIFTLNEAIKYSLQYSWKHYPQLSEYVKCHAREMEESVMRQHIDLYVNAFTESMGADGRLAIMKMMTTITGREITPEALFI